MHFEFAFDGKCLRPKFYLWVRPIKYSPKKATFCVCGKAFALCNMRKTAVRSRMQSGKYERNICSKPPNIISFFKWLISFVTPSSSLLTQSYVCVPAQETILSTNVSCTLKTSQKKNTTCMERIMFLKQKWSDIYSISHL